MEDPAQDVRRLVAPELSGDPLVECITRRGRGVERKDTKGELLVGEVLVVFVVAVAGTGSDVYVTVKFFKLGRMARKSITDIPNLRSKFSMSFSRRNTA